LWGQGLPDQAQATSWQAVDDARQLGHVFSLAHAMQRAGMASMLLEDAAACRTILEELLPLAERNKFPWPLADALFLRGWLEARDGHYETGIKPMIESANQPIFAAFRPVYLLQIAREELRAGQPERAMATLERTAGEAEKGRNHFCEPEIARLRGEVLLAQSRANDAAAEQAFRDAAALAARQSCRPLELRAATSLARLLAEKNKREEARDMLAPLYSAFTEGHARPDLRAAKSLLDGLS